MRFELELGGSERWAWGRNGEIQRPKWVTVRDTSTLAPAVTISVYANDRTLSEGKSPIDLRISAEDARRFADALREAADAADTYVHEREAATSLDDSGSGEE